MSSYLLWFISDLENEQHYLIKNEDKRLRVYRDYELPAAHRPSFDERPDLSLRGSRAGD